MVQFVKLTAFLTKFALSIPYNGKQPAVSSQNYYYNFATAYTGGTPYDRNSTIFRNLRPGDQCRITAPAHFIQYLQDYTDWDISWGCEYIISGSYYICVVETTPGMERFQLTIGYGAESYQCDEVDYGNGPGITEPNMLDTTTASISGDRTLTYGQTCGKYPGANRIMNGQAATHHSTPVS